MVCVEQLELDLDSIVIEEDMSAGEVEAMVADFLGRYSDSPRAEAALRPRPCECAPDGIGERDPELFQVRCIKCGRSPSASNL
jgi:hypothetical protein